MERDEGPAITLPLLSPLACTIASHTRTFSTPFSTRFLEGQRFSSFCTAWKRSRTVSAKLFEFLLRKIIRLENPSMHPCMTIFHLINEWWPSKCHTVNLAMELGKFDEKQPPPPPTLTQCFGGALFQCSLLFAFPESLIQETSSDLQHSFAHLQFSDLICTCLFYLALHLVTGQNL